MGRQQQQQMYPGARGYGANTMNGQYQYNGQYNGQYGQQQAAYPQQQQQFQPGYNQQQQQQQHAGYPGQQQQWYGQGYDQTGANWQQQTQMGWNSQWNAGAQQQQQSAGNWSSNMSPRTDAATPAMYNGNSAVKDPKRAAATATSAAATAGNKTNVEMQPEAYQRTLEYVQNCQNSWSMSPDSSNGAKPKRSPPHSADNASASAAASAVMPPPQAAPSAPQTNNMIIGDMSSSMNLLSEETRFLHMMQ